MGNSGAYSGKSMKGLNARIKMHIKPTKDGGGSKQTKIM